MSDFAHVISDHVRYVLTAATAPSAQDITRAAHITRAAFREDAQSDFIAFEVMDERGAAIDAMDICAARGDARGVLSAMHRFWSV